MDVFISWSGERSRAAAEALHGWLPKIINAIKPWLSSADIDKGARWSTDVATRLEAAKAGIICLTPSNLHSDWVLFEAGALSKTLKNTFVCPFLIGLDPSDVKPPLAQFQATRAVKEDVLKLLKTLNSALGDNALPEAHIDEAFDVWWPKLDTQLKALPPEEGGAKPHRDDRELLEEILSLVRNQNRSATPVHSGRIPANSSEAPSIAEVRSLVNEALTTNGDRVVEMYLIGTGPERLVYQIQTEKDRHHLRLPLPFVPDQAVQIIKEQFSAHRMPLETNLTDIS